MRVSSRAGLPVEQPWIPGKQVAIVAACVYLLFFGVGTLGHYLPVTRELMLKLTPYVLLLFGMSTLIPFIRTRAWMPLLWVAGTYLITFALEAIGVATGVIFGAYDYGPTLGPKVLAVPVIIGFNWAIVVLGATAAADWIVTRLSIAHAGPDSDARTDSAAARGSRVETAGAPVTDSHDHPARHRAPRLIRYVVAPLLVGLIAVIFDLALEPVAMQFDYWQWGAGVVPFQNYLAWFVIAAAVSVPYFAIRRSGRFSLPLVYVIVQFLFVASLLPIAAG